MVDERIEIWHSSQRNLPVLLQSLVDEQSSGGPDGCGSACTTEAIPKSLVVDGDVGIGGGCNIG